MNTHHIQLNVPLSFTQLLDVARQLTPMEKFRLGCVLWDETNENEIESKVRL